jgi:hypothetical protein
VGSLEEYLNDPNFEQNRIEYKANKDSADKGLKNGRANPKKVEKGERAYKQWGRSSHLFLPVAGSSAPPAPEAAPEGSSSKDKSKAEPARALTDFFSAIEDGTTIFNPQTG